MKYLVVAALVALSATDAEACLAGRARSRSVGRTRTVTQNVQTHSYVPTVKQVEKTVMVPEVRMVPQTVMVPKKVVENVTVNVPVVTSTPVTVSREAYRARGVVRGILPCR